MPRKRSIHSKPRLVGGERERLGDDRRREIAYAAVIRRFAIRRHDTRDAEYALGTLRLAAFLAPPSDESGETPHSERRQSRRHGDRII